MAVILTDWIPALMILLGAFFMSLASIGVVRLPDVWMRMHASTKSATFGIGCMAVGLAVSHLHDLGVVMRSIIIIGFVFQTAPVAAHMIGRAAYRMGVQPWMGTKRDELRGRYDPETQNLAGQDDTGQNDH
jgi:multicomponent Na+:H+ antiporter subunit G